VGEEILRAWPMDPAHSESIGSRDLRTVASRGLLAMADAENVW
jgi:hypothetical protein